MPSNDLIEQTYTRSHVAAFMLYAAAVLRRCDEPAAAHFFCELGDHLAANRDIPSLSSETLTEEVKRILGVNHV